MRALRFAVGLAFGAVAAVTFLTGIVAALVAAHVAEERPPDLTPTQEREHWFRQREGRA